MIVCCIAYITSIAYGKEASLPFPLGNGLTKLGLLCLSTKACFFAIGNGNEATLPSGLHASLP